ARRAVSQLLDAKRPDIVHCRNIYHHLSPSILAEFQERGIPVVMTIADYKLVCPNYKLFRNGTVCNECTPGRYHPALLHKCVKDSFLASALCAAEAVYHHHSRAYADRLTAILTPSRFACTVLADHGLPTDKLAVLRHFLDPSEWSSPPSTPSGRPYLVAFGRLSPEKGIDVAISAIAKVRGVDLAVVGQGPEESSLRRTAEREAPGRVRFLGYRQGDDLRRIIADSLAVVMPSVWYEVFGLSVLESFALGKAVVGSRIGAIPELVIDDETGLTFAPGDADDLARQVSALVSDPALATRMGAAAKAMVALDLGPERHYRDLIKIYEASIERRLPGGDCPDFNRR
ncbi:MAG: glycosyltransferase family 4 protein, partial [Coriobacteriia bacterium]|nr:glycosyltransferase family 4 protein [Coriobacteriia bacterium]